MSICRVVHYAKGCKAPGYCYYGPSNHEKCRPAECQSCSTIISILKLKQDMPTSHDARNCHCVPYIKKKNERKMTHKIADELYLEYLNSGKLAEQIKIENRNRDTNIWLTNENLCKPGRKINIDDLFKQKSDSTSYVYVLLSEKGGSKGVSSEIVSSVDVSSVDVSSEIVSSKVVSSKVVSSVDESLAVTLSEDESDEVKSIRVLLLKFQNLERVLINTGNGTKNDFESISKSINSLTEELKALEK